MPTNTSRLSLVIPASTDNESLFPSQAATTYGILDNATLVTEGTLASRPLVGSVEHNHIYRATDTGVYYFSDGTNWRAMAVPGQWAALTLGTGIIAGSFYTPSVRLEGDRVWFKGDPVNNTGSSLSTGYTFATLPSSAYYPSAAVPFIISGNGVPLQVNTNGAITVTTLGVGSGAGVHLNGVSYTLS